MQDYFKKYLTEHIFLIENIKNNDLFLNKVEICSNKIISALNKNKKIIFAGNGGSAAEAQHMSAELVGKLNLDRNALKSISLTTDTSIMTSIANDYDFKYLFSRQIEALGEKGDILIVYSTSGKSKNIKQAIKVAVEKKIFVIGLCGQNGFQSNNCDIELKVSSIKTSIIQEAHNLLGHMIFSKVEEEIFCKKKIK